ncbi:acyltransferase family protein [Phyllobacterium sp. 22552]|uniref:acyltransferase family protein n=1 Tax=Phyllobacterium sp. 22552 TaxID=3453941 RepID=UPI003F857DD7
MRLGFLASLRGFAAFYVVVYHMALVPNFKPVLPEWASSTILYGGSGVTLFFLLSAFSLCLTMGRHLNNGSPLKSFYGSRLFRIAPLFYLILAVSLVFHGLYFKVWHGPLSILNSLLFTFNFTPGTQEGIVWASWTIGVEMVFYLMFPLLFFVLNTPVKKIIALGISIIAAAEFAELVSADFFKYSIVKHLPVFLIGMVVFDVYGALTTRVANTYTKLVGIALTAIGIVGLAYLISGGSMPLINDYYWQASFYGSVFLGLGVTPLRPFVSKVFGSLADISYSVYLIHAPIVFLLSPAYEFVYGLGLPIIISLAGCLGITGAIVVPLAQLLYKKVEQPMERLGKSFLARPLPALPDQIPVPISAIPVDVRLSDRPGSIA